MVEARRVRRAGERWEEEGTGEYKGDAARGVEQEWCRATRDGTGDGEGAVSSLVRQGERVGAGDEPVRAAQ